MGQNSHGFYLAAINSKCQPWPTQQFGGALETVKISDGQGGKKKLAGQTGTDVR